MVFAGDLWVLLPVKDLYDTLMMAMAINAAKDMYDKGLKLIEDFYTKYGDFTSPIQKDMDWYQQNVTGKALLFINDLYANGIDPLRSAEGRAAVAQLIHSMPMGDIAKIKLSAETAKEYLKSMDDDTNPEFEKFLGRDLSTWSTLGDAANGVKKNGVWGASKSSKFKTLQEYVHPSFANIKPHMMNEKEVRDRGYEYDPQYEYVGVTRDDMERSMKDWLPGIRNEGLYAYYREQAKQDLVRMGYENPTEDQIDKQFVENAITADSQMMTPLTREANPYVLDDYRTRNDMRAHAANRKVDHDYWVLEHSGDDVEKYNRVFRRAEQLAYPNDKKFAGDLVQYTPQELYSQWIDPVNQGGLRNVKLESGEVVPSYVFSKDVMKRSGSIYKLGGDGMFYKSSVHTAKGDYTFVPDGNMRARYIGKVGNKNAYKYYISGMLLDPYSRVVTNDGDNVTWIAVKERDHNYGQNLKKE